nr:MAG TPA: hypothetical protein [Caudoviricetes sp.]
MFFNCIYSIYLYHYYIIMWLIFYTSKNPFNGEIFHKWTISSFLITDLSDMIVTENDIKVLCAKS